ncbi:hypothetical protein IF1G_10269 [Cordyceps javanica]|uniref:Uncharacterized protein n=1 Tax=Cordyceps javanica TaxID=43265 RepID=A0A545VM52_9HYPO|nr:hypothetical protein IF1G_10269 [Cordyceps javanica]TQW02780.1 hypothetical protein IF2G_09662 [Cordyceps javanica]
MNERSRATNGSHPPGPQRSRAGATGAASAQPYQSSSLSSQASAGTQATSRDRTHLFRSHLMRRPAGSGGGAAAAANGASISSSSSINTASAAAPTAAAAAAAAAQAEAARLAAAEQQQRLHAEMCEIVVRNQNGDIDLDAAPVLSFDDMDEMALDARQEMEQERQRLAEDVKQHRINHTAGPDQPEELLERVRLNLRAKVDALAEDNWMFEPEEPARG